MTDHYIDNAETQVYGPALRSNVARLLQRELADADASLRATLQFVIARQADADQMMATALGVARAQVSSLSAAAAAKGTALGDARVAMRALYKHLDARREAGQWMGDVALFFPAGLGGIPKFGRTLLPAMRVALAALKADRTVPDHADHLKRLTRAEGAVEAHVVGTGDAHHEARGLLSEQATEKGSWLLAYRGNALLVEGVLTHQGRGDLLVATVPHLGVPDSPANAGAAPVAPVAPVA
ncbi:MAG: hypothetical protein JWM10_5301 [Myxococcaceae bacterium]|nr:hypothetical protein [Myxococcaceae bacterium]